MIYFNPEVEGYFRIKDEKWKIVKKSDKFVRLDKFVTVYYFLFPLV